ncbi:hypothetical protein JZO76_00110 [Enterococcus sp. MJM12]|uniref:DUF5067 domain-containing protein n=1 Tax=Candidatus Enterococcus myersii TaxID=2815322 RepID=A0ABS3H3C5_9ENTE|nr:hypothetical protein [Enterococcus sp. MJM12]MBO0447931.1 hypothetical protein [Enterococcus sp. MJM12]
MRNQSQDLKNKRLTWIVIILLVIIAILLGYLAISSFYSKNDTDSSSLAESTESSTSISNDISSTSSEDFIKESTSSQEEYKYAVTFPKDQMQLGYYGTWEFFLSTHTDGDHIIISWNTPEYEREYGNYMSERCTFVPQTIPTTIIRVNEHSRIVKDVKVNTQLVPSSDPGSISSDFFYPFDGENTKVYAYYMNNGYIAVIFSPGKGLDQYQLIEFRPN